MKSGIKKSGVGNFWEGDVNQGPLTRKDGEVALI
jgi:hypothetical protein